MNDKIYLSGKNIYLPKKSYDLLAEEGLLDKIPAGYVITIYKENSDGTAVEVIKTPV